MQPGDRLVVVGASLAGVRAAEAARAAGFGGRITLIGSESHPPYDRPSLSKAFLDPAGDTTPVALASVESLADKGIDLVLGEPATHLDPADRAIFTTSAEHPFSTAVIATGSRPVQLPGSRRMDGVHVLRSLEDARAIRAALDNGARTVVIGGGFIGAEVTSAARKRGLPVTIVEAAEVPLARAVGADMGMALSALHTRFGTDLRLGTQVVDLEGDDRVECVVLSDGSRLAADLVVVGIGSRPATEWLEPSGLELDDGVVCDEFLQTSVEGVFAAGDVARWHNPLFNRSSRIEHFTAAAEQGAQAARNALTPHAAKAYETVPYFWSDWYGSRIQFVGLVTDEWQVVAGDLTGEHFVVLYRERGRVVGALTLNGQRHIMKYRRMIAARATYDEALAFASRRQVGV